MRIVPTWRPVAAASWLAAAMVCPFGLVAFGSAPASAATSHQSVSVDATSCAQGWSLPASGAVALEVMDRARVTVDVELVDRRNGAVVAALKELGPGTTLPLVASVVRGQYRLLCTYDNPYGVSLSKPYVVRSSTVETVSAGVSPSAATPAFVPVTDAQMAKPLASYDKYVAGQIVVLQSTVAALERDVAARNTAQAETDWSSAELTFSTIGGTYGAIGGLQNDINGLPSGFAGGAVSSQFQGLHKIEYMLWSGQPGLTIEPYVNNLAVALNSLSLKWSEGAMDANQLSTRAHEILEDTLRDTLSGDDDEGSGDSLAIVGSDLQGEKVVLNLLGPVIKARAPELLVAADSELNSLVSAVQATDVGGHWITLASMTTSQREDIDGEVDQLLETLSPIPDLLELQGFTDGQEA